MRIFLIVAAGISLAGCSSMSTPDFLKPKPPEASLQLDSTPPGADAVTSVGPGCKTPCTVTVPAADNFTVTFNMPKFESQTVPITVVQQSGASPILDPNPAVVELQPAAPVKKKPPAKKKPAAARKPAAAAAPPAQAPSPFPPVSAPRQ